MHITFEPRNMVHVDDARILWPNFSGNKAEFNEKGQRKFNLIIANEEIYNALREAGFNVKMKPAREEGDDPLMYLEIKVGYHPEYPNVGPNVYLITGNRQNKLDQDTVGCLDSIRIRSVDLDFQGRAWEKGGRSGITAWLRALRVYQDYGDRFAQDYEDYLASQED